MHRRRAFTLVELLVVIGMIAVLIGILLPTINRAREQAMDVRCAANLRTTGQALLSYALENKNRFPAHTGGGRWLWDLPYATRDAIVKSGAVRASMYCPIYDDQDVDGLWNYEPFSVTGYFWLTPRLDGEYPPEETGVTAAPGVPGSLAKKLDYQPKLVSIRSTEIEIVTDATISQNSTNGDDGYFVNVQGGYLRPHDTSHINSSDRARGGNILYMDGHVVWRPFREMFMRARLPEVQFWY